MFKCPDAAVVWAWVMAMTRVVLYDGGAIKIRATDRVGKRGATALAATAAMAAGFIVGVSGCD